MIEPTDREIAGRHGTLVVREWAGANPGWIALIAHGYGEHSGRYQWVAERLVEFDEGNLFALDRLPAHSEKLGHLVQVRRRSRRDR